MSGTAIRQTRFGAGEGATHILLVRHAESAAIRAGDEWPTVAGHGNPPLHPHGRAQAERVAARLAGERLNAVYVTPFDRTRDTAAPLLRRLRMEALEEWDLREFHFGDWESPMARKYFAEGHPIARRINEEERWDIPPGAESHEAFGRRVTTAIRRIADRHTGEVVAVFSHGGVIGRILAEAAGSRPFAFTIPDNASISHLVVGRDKWTVRRFNDIGHLSDRFVDVPDLPWDGKVDADADAAEAEA